MLDLEFDQEQELLRQTVRDVLAKHCSLDVVRAMEDDPVGYPATLWAQLGELDLIGLLLPEEYGGSAMTLIEGVALYEELGRSLAPTPHFVSAVLGGGVLAAAGSPAQKERWLRPVTSGVAILTRSLARARQRLCRPWRRAAGHARKVRLPAERREAPCRLRRGDPAAGGVGPHG